jgi:hypothetical protein
LGDGLRLIDGKFYTILLFISNFFLLNLLWLVMCLPIITIFPATAAMYGVVRQWIIHKDPSIFRPFFHYFKENFKQSILIEIDFCSKYYSTHYICIRFLAYFSNRFPFSNDGPVQSDYQKPLKEYISAWFLLCSNQFGNLFIGITYWIDSIYLSIFNSIYL